VQARRFGAELLLARPLTGVSAGGPGYVAEPSDGTLVRGRAMLFAGGVEWRRLDVAGIDDPLGAGVYCGAGPSEAGSADWTGALVGVTALAAITYAIIVLPGAGVSSPRFAAAAVLGLLSSAAFAVAERRGSHPMLPPAIFAPAQFRAANAVTFVVNGALGGFAFVFIPALEIVAGYSPVVAGSALVPVTVMTVLLSGASGRLAQRIGPRPPLVAGCVLCALASMLAVRIGSHSGYWTVVFPMAVLFGLGLASLIPPLTASAMNSAPDSLAGLASGVNNAVARVAGLLWIAALPPITGLIGATYTDPARFRSSFGQISWTCAAAARSPSAALREDSPVLPAYVLNFACIGIYWNNHHHMLAASLGSCKDGVHIRRITLSGDTGDD
jgi:Major Facilitator Superfamily